MELYNQNPFRTKAMASASFKIDKLPFPAVDATLEQLAEQPGIGKSTAEKISMLIETGSFKELDDLIIKTPEGILAMLSIKGLGPKKVQIIWNDLGIDTVGELLYACNENRLVEAKGFGLKTQEEIRKAIEFANAAQGLFLYAKAEKIAQPFFMALTEAFKEELHSFTGEFRRKCEIVSSIDIITTAPEAAIVRFIEENKDFTLLERFDASLQFTDLFALKYQILFSSSATFAYDLLLSTGSDTHIEQLLAIGKDIPQADSEASIYSELGLSFIEPELREGLQELTWAKEHKLPQLISYSDLKGTLHNHSTYSDGVHSLEQMANYCKNELGLGYLGICDHSKTAVYANGLSVERLAEQWQEVDSLNVKLAPFKIFKGIESDILGDGSLDYPAEILGKFDFVVASVHSNLRMDEEKATQRLIRAIENPYTTILGHPTGRLLLSRAGYALDFKKIIDACAANQVVIEVNSNPLRLDLDWRWHQYALEKGVLLSINPDAHRTEGLLDMQYGVHVARKGGLSANRCLNAFTTEEIASFFQKRKTARL